MKLPKLNIRFLPETQSLRSEWKTQSVPSDPVADYRAGGKLGPPAPGPDAETAAIPETQTDAVVAGDPKLPRDMAAAARVLSDAVEEKKGGRGADVGSRLSRSFWTELLD